MTAAVVKYATGIGGFDEMTGGGLPQGRLTAIIGSAGSGKTVFGLQTLVNRLKASGDGASGDGASGDGASGDGASGEGVIFVSFEESIDRILSNVAAFDWDPDVLTGARFRFVDARLPPDAVISGGFDLSGLLAGLTVLREDIGARSIVFDGVDMLLSGLRDEALERRELSRLDAWIRESGMSAIITAKVHEASARDQGNADFLEYMTDCVVRLTATFSQTESSRSLRIDKFRGSDFAANPVPMVIGRSGFEVIATRAARASHPTFTGRVSSGVARLDRLLDGGYVRGSSVLVSGSPGTTKTSLGASFAGAACARGERALFVSFDESGSQIIQNMRSIGLELQPYIDSENLFFVSLVAAGRSPEKHFMAIRDSIDLYRPDCLVIDPISSILKGSYPFAHAVCESLLDHAKLRGVTLLCTSLLNDADGATELSLSKVSTIADTWIQVSYMAREGERNRALTIIKSRGTAHSNQVRELVLSSSGIDLVDVYVAEGEVLMGSARAQKEAEGERIEARRSVEAQLRLLQIEREIAELGHRVRTATLALELRQQEAEYEKAAEAKRVGDRRAAAEHRIELRRPANEALGLRGDGLRGDGLQADSGRGPGYSS